MGERADKTIGDYVLLQQIGAGGMGEVWLAENIHTRLRYAVKLLPSQATQDQNFVARFFDEGRLMAQLEHPGIVRVHHVGCDQPSQRYYLVMDFVAGPAGEPQSIHALLDASKAGRLQEDQVYTWAGQIAHALAYAHARGIVHRDIKPANVLIDEKGDARITDFGLAKAIGEAFLRAQLHESLQPNAGRPPTEKTLSDQQTIAQESTRRMGTSSAESLLGTYDYMSPEQRGELPGTELGPASDVYAFGVMLYRMLTGRRPSGRAKAVSQLVPELSRPWDAIVDRCLEHHPSDRFADGTQLEAALRSLQGVNRPSPVKWVALLLLLALMAGVGYIGWEKNRQSDTRAPEATVKQLKPAVAGDQGAGEGPDLGTQTIAEEAKAQPAETGDKDKAGLTGPQPKQPERPIAFHMDVEPAGAHLILTHDQRGKVLDQNVPEQGLQSVTQQSPSLSALAGGIRVTALSTVANDDYLAGQTAQVQINSNRPIATRLPFVQEDLSCETHRVSLQVPGYASPEAQQITVQDGQTAMARFVLEPQAGQIVLNANVPQAEVLDESGKKLGNLGERLSLAPFVTHRLTVKAQGYKPQIVLVQITSPGTDAGLKQVELTRTALPVAGEEWTVSGLDMELAFVQAGSFLMGSNDHESDEGPPHAVQLTRDFWMGKCEVSNAQYQTFVTEAGYDGSVEADNSYLRHHRDMENASTADDFPIVYVSWHNATAFCQWLTARERQTGRLPPAYAYRLPTEAEWEYAERGGAKSKSLTYAGSNDLGEVSWYGSNSGKKTHACGLKRPNELGIYDMAGNVREWCYDLYDKTYYDKGPDTDPVNVQTGSYRVYRGGSWYESANECRATNRFSFRPTYTSSRLGFRIVLAPALQDNVTQ